MFFRNLEISQIAYLDIFAFFQYLCYGSTTVRNI